MGRLLYLLSKRYSSFRLATTPVGCETNGSKRICISSYKLGKSWSCCPPLCVLACPLRQSSVCLSLSYGVVLGHSSTFTISCKALPGHSVDADCLHISHADFFISKVRVAGCSPPQCKLATEDTFWNATILHTADMTQPPQSALSK